MNPQRWLLFAGILGAAGILIGAFGAHALPKVPGTTPKSLEWLKTGVEYHMVHVLALVGIGIASHLWPSAKWKLAGYCFLSGILIFSGLLYVMSVTQIRILGAFVPIGGISFVVGWIFLALAAKSSMSNT